MIEVNQRMGFEKAFSFGANGVKREEQLQRTQLCLDKAKALSEMLHAAESQDLTLRPGIRSSYALAIYDVVCELDECFEKLS